MTAVLGADEKVFQPDAVAAQPRGERAVVERHARDRAVVLRDQRPRHGIGAEEVMTIEAPSPNWASSGGFVPQS